jgi:hypothetical protein
MNSNKKNSIVLVLAFALATGLSACSPEVGSKEWCAELKEKPKGDWTTNEATDFAKHCIM